MPIYLFIFTFCACVSFGDISVTILATPIYLLVSTLASITLRIVEITIIASPAYLFIATFTGIPLRYIPPIRLIHSSSTSLHGIASRITNMASSTRPINFLIVAFLASITFLNTYFTVLTIPLHNIFLVINF